MARGAGYIFSIVVVLLAWSIMGACGDDGGEGPEARPNAGGESAAREIVARVDGVGISAADVRAMVALTDLSPEDALARLEERELLAAEARRRGFDARRQHDVVRAQARVQQYLASRVEEVVSPGSITDEAIAERYGEWAHRFRVPERRASLHLLTQVPEGAGEDVWLRAEAFAGDVLAEALAGEPEAVLNEMAQLEPPGPLTLKLEDLPAFADDGSLEAPYSAALFATPAGTMVPATVRTSYGVHAIYVQRIEARIDVSLADATPEIREALVIEGRAALLQEILQRIAEERPVEVNDPGFALASELEIDS